MDTDELRRALEAVLRRDLQLPTLTVRALEPLTGGASRETWSFRADGGRFILQRELPGNTRPGESAMEAAVVRAAAKAGVPTVEVVSASAHGDDLDAPYLISRHVDGETIARKILRDDTYAAARRSFASDCGRALAAIHSVELGRLPDLPRRDQVAEYRQIVDELDESRPAFELAFHWLDANRPPSVREALVHGDFRLGNLIIGPDGLRAVIDWELAHIGDPVEDLGWLCMRAWRFGGASPVAGVATRDELLTAYCDASGYGVGLNTLRWWEVLSTLKWGVMCLIQSRKHLDGLSRSLELAAIGRRVCETEHDLLHLLEPDALARASKRMTAVPPPPAGIHGRPTASELLGALREWIANDVRGAAHGALCFQTRVAENVLRMLEREVTMDSVMAGRHERRLARLAARDEQELAVQIRNGEVPTQEAVPTVAASVIDKLLVTNPGWVRQPGASPAARS